MENKGFKLRKNKNNSNILNGVVIILILLLILLSRNVILGFITSSIEIWQNYSSYFLRGLMYTIGLSLVSVLVGTVLGTLFYFLRESQVKVLSKLSKAIVELLRGTPILLQLYIVFIGIGSLIDVRSLGISTSDFALLSGGIAVSINSGAYVSEIIRSGIQSVGPGQMEAGRSLGMDKWMTMREVIIPQAIKNIFPALVNEFIAIIKETSIVSFIGVTDIMYNVNLVRSGSYKSMEPLLISGVLYFIITYGLSKVAAFIERKMA